MKPQGIQNSYLKLQVSGIAVVLTSIGIMGTLIIGTPSVAAVAPAPTSFLAAQADEPMLRHRERCEHCAVITSFREIEPLEQGIQSGAGSRAAKTSETAVTAKSALRYEVTVRMRDGSARVIEQAQPANWGVNERLILIGGDSTRKKS